VWVTVSTTLALIILLDFGVASTMTNLISEAYAHNDRDLGGQYASTGFWVMVFIALALGGIGSIAWPMVHWAALFHLHGEANESIISHTAAAAFIIFLIGLPASLAAKFLAGYQEVGAVNLVAAIGAIGSLFATILITRSHGGMVELVIGSSGVLVGTNLGCLTWIWCFHKPWLAPSLRRFDLGSVKSLLHSGSEFFILQLAGIVVFNSDNFVIAHYLGPSQVTPYSVTSKLVGYSAALQIIITPAIWPAYAEAYIRKDLVWMRRALFYVMLATMGFAVICSAVLVVWGRAIIRFWAGEAAVPTQTVIVLMCIWILICTFMSNTATVLMATNETTIQAWLSVVATVLNLGVSIWLVQRMGPPGVLLGTIGSYIVVLIWPQTRKVLQVLRNPCTTSRSVPANETQ
jgi:O-antigen/teichoic acid export membrane protein